MKLNLKVRFKNPVFVAQIILSIIMPILGYAGMTAQDVTTWNILGNVLVESVKNPYVLGLVVVSVWNALNDPTTKGIGDSENALTYTEPK